MRPWFFVDLPQEVSPSLCTVAAVAGVASSVSAEGRVLPSEVTF